MEIVIENMKDKTTAREVSAFVRNASRPFPARCSSLHGWVLAMLYHHEYLTTEVLETKALNYKLSLAKGDLSAVLVDLVTAEIIKFSKTAHAYKLRNVKVYRDSWSLEKRFNSFAGLGTHNTIGYSIFMTVPHDSFIKITDILNVLEDEPYISLGSIQRTIQRLEQCGLIESSGKNRTRTVRRTCTLKDLPPVMAAALL